MPKEIERKFLLKNDNWRRAVVSKTRLVQGYFISTGGPGIRVRIAGDAGFLTIKGELKNFTRSEFEYRIPAAEAEAMLREFCGTRLVEKYRYLVRVGKHVWEVDEYLGLNSGLYTAEIELASEEEEFERPDWLGKEVSLDRRYGNGSLAQKPFTKW